MAAAETFEQYQSRVGEAAAKIVLKELGGLELLKIPEQKGVQTPDYEIRNSGGETVGFCEVKSLVDFLTSDGLNRDVTYEELAELSRRKDRNHRSKLRQHLGNAISQLKDYRRLPTLVMFVSFDMTDYIDMGQVLEEHKDLYPADTLPDSFIIMKVHQPIQPSGTFDVKETVRILYDSDRGKEFGERYLHSSDAAKRAGLLPLTFRL